MNLCQSVGYLMNAVCLPEGSDIYERSCHDSQSLATVQTTVQVLNITVEQLTCLLHILEVWVSCRSQEMGYAD
jgi:hypothetical protein